MQRRVFLSLGSNMGDRRQYLKNAIDALPDIVNVSSVYETEPVEVSGEQNSYLNLVVELLTDLSPHELLSLAGSLEEAAERVRVEVNGPRTLDVDILWIDNEVVEDVDLKIPHPRMWQRRFVLEPLGEIAPELLPADWAENAQGKVWKVGRL